MGEAGKRGGGSCRVFNRSHTIAGRSAWTTLSMPRDTRTRRLTGPASAAASPGGAETPPPPLVSLLAHTPRLIDILPHLHQHAIDVTGGSCSLLFEQNPRNGAMQATSGFGLDVLRTDPWLPGPDESALIAGVFSRRT